MLAGAPATTPRLVSLSQWCLPWLCAQYSQLVVEVQLRVLPALPAPRLVADFVYLSSQPRVALARSSGNWCSVLSARTFTAERRNPEASTELLLETKGEDEWFQVLLQFRSADGTVDGAAAWVKSTKLLINNHVRTTCDGDWTFFDQQLGRAPRVPGLHSLTFQEPLVAREPWLRENGTPVQHPSAPSVLHSHRVNEIKLVVDWTNAAPPDAQVSCTIIVGKYVCWENGFVTVQPRAPAPLADAAVPPRGANNGDPLDGSPATPTPAPARTWSQTLLPGFLQWA